MNHNLLHKNNYHFFLSDLCIYKNWADHTMYINSSQIFHTYLLFYIATTYMIRYDEIHEKGLCIFLLMGKKTHERNYSPFLYNLQSQEGWLVLKQSLPHSVLKFFYYLCILKSYYCIFFFFPSFWGNQDRTLLWRKVTISE